MRNFQRFRPVKIDPNDRLYSEIIRFGQTRCLMCGRHRPLQACHIIGRGHYATRFLLDPVTNAVALDAGCHSWLDEHKILAVVLDPSKRVFTWKDESFTFLVQRCGYTWEDLVKLYMISRRNVKYTGFYAQEIQKQLSQELRRLKREHSRVAAQVA